MPGDPHGYFDSSETMIVEFVATPADNDPTPRVRTPRDILHWMKMRRLYYGSPLPEGYVPPPGIDIEELLKQLPPLPPDLAGGGA